MLKTKKPYIRRWFHGKGDDTYSQIPVTKKGLVIANYHKKKGQDIVVAYKGKEYTPTGFLKKYPKYKLKQGKK